MSALFACVRPAGTISSFRFLSATREHDYRMSIQRHVRLTHALEDYDVVVRLLVRFHFVPFYFSDPHEAGSAWRTW
jgi:hypothetical protein